MGSRLTQVTSLSNGMMLVLFSEISNTTGVGLGEGREMKFSVLDMVNLKFLKHSYSSSRQLAIISLS